MPFSNSYFLALHTATIARPIFLVNCCLTRSGLQTCRHISLRHAEYKRRRGFTAHLVRGPPEKAFVLRHQAFYRALRVAILDYHAMIQCHLHPRGFHSLRPSGERGSTEASRPNVRPGQRSNNERLLTNALCRYYVKSFPFS